MRLNIDIQHKKKPVYDNMTIKYPFYVTILRMGFLGFIQVFVFGKLVRVTQLMQILPSRVWLEPQDFVT